MKKARFHLTRQAAKALREIYSHSLKQWGEKSADKYMADLYAVMKKAAINPEIGRFRAHRAVPFLMAPSGRHFIVYDRLEGGIVILTLLHQRRDIEKIIANRGPSFLVEIEMLKRKTAK